MLLGVGIAEQNSFVTVLNTAPGFRSCASIPKQRAILDYLVI